MWISCSVEMWFLGGREARVPDTPHSCRHNLSRNTRALHTVFWICSLDKWDTRSGCHGGRDPGSSIWNRAIDRLSWKLLLINTSLNFVVIATTTVSYADTVSSPTRHSVTWLCLSSHKMFPTCPWRTCTPCGPPLGQCSLRLWRDTRSKSAHGKRDIHPPAWGKTDGQKIHETSETWGSLSMADIQ